MLSHQLFSARTYTKVGLACIFVLISFVLLCSRVDSIYYGAPTADLPATSYAILDIGDSLRLDETVDIKGVGTVELSLVLIICSGCSVLTGVVIVILALVLNKDKKTAERRQTAKPYDPAAPIKTAPSPKTSVPLRPVISTPPYSAPPSTTLPPAMGR
jgi:hypothetical protein